MQNSITTHIVRSFNIYYNFQFLDHLHLKKFFTPPYKILAIFRLNVAMCKDSLGTDCGPHTDAVSFWRVLEPVSQIYQVFEIVALLISRLLFYE